VQPQIFGLFAAQIFSLFATQLFSLVTARVFCLVAAQVCRVEDTHRSDDGVVVRGELPDELQLEPDLRRKPLVT
jgi:hypothetical protein